MPLFFSVYLDCLRILACSCVYLGHNGLPWLQIINRVEDYYSTGYDAVMLFFVLSGYVIAFAAEQIEKTPRNYIINRFARIVPAAFAAILLSWFLMRMAHDLLPLAYTDVNQLHHPWHFGFLSLFFLNEVWWNEFTPFQDGAYWSLSYEAWYYLLYFCLVFLTGRKRYILFLVGLLAAGPKIAFLAPVWFAGVAAYKWRDKWRLSKKGALFFFVMPAVCYWGLKRMDIQISNYSMAYHFVGQRIEEFMGHGLGAAASFVWSYVLALLIIAHIYAARHLPSLRGLETPFWAQNIKKIAGYTYSVYIFHMPLAVFFIAVLQRNLEITVNRIALQIGVLPMIILLAHATEHQKPRVRDWLRRRFPEKEKSDIVSQ